MKKFVSTLALLLVAFSIFAQDLTIPNVSPKMRKFRGVEAIKGLGYYCFAVDEKSKRGYRIFKLYIWDYDLNEISSSEIELTKKSWIIDAVFNGENFLVALYDNKNDNVRTIVFDKSGNTVADKVADGIKTRFMAIEDYRPSFYADGTDGFYGIIPDKEPKFGFNIIRYSNTLDILWRTSYFPSKGMQTVFDAESDGEKLVLIKATKDKRFTKKVDMDLTAFSREDGKEQWTYDLYKRGKLLLPTELSMNPNGEVSVAGMFFLGTKMDGINSDGIFFAQVDKDGEEIGFASEPWKGKLQDFLRSSKSGWNIGKPKVVFEDIIYDEATGNIRLIGELFSVNTAGRVLNALSNDNSSEVRVTMEDIVVFTFSREGEFVDFYGVDKARFTIFLLETYAGGVALTQLLKQSGALPYRTCGLNENGEVIAFYIDFMKEVDGELVSAKTAAFNGGKVGLGMLNLTQSNADETVVNHLPISKKAAKKDKSSDIEFDSRRSVINITESKPGYVLVSELSKKTGDLNLFLEKID